MSQDPHDDFLSQLDTRLAACSYQDLCHVLRELGRYLPEERRAAFLAILQPHSGQSTPAAEPPPPRADTDLLADLRSLYKRLAANMNNGGEYWHYDDEDAIGPYADYVDEVLDGFNAAQQCLATGEIALAQSAYELLIEICGLEDNYGRRISSYELESHGLDHRGVALDYLSTVYRLAEGPQRATAYYQALRQLTRRGFTDSSQLSLTALFIRHLDLPDREGFLDAWIADLQDRSGPQDDVWLRDAIGLYHGTDGLGDLARREGEKRPHAYLDWCQALCAEQRHAELLTAAEEAYQRLPKHLAIRAAIADYQAQAAETLENPSALLTARWTALQVNPKEERLLALWQTVPPPQRPALMAEAIQRLTTLQQAAATPLKYVTSPGLLPGQQPGYPPSAALLARAYLLAGDLDGLLDQVDGWPSNTFGDNPALLTATVLLRLLSDRTPARLPPQLAALWQTVSTAFRLAWETCATTLTVDDTQRQRYGDWCLDYARRWVDVIVGEQHRHRYPDAARLAVACTEVMAIDDRNSTFITTIRQRFPRHRAFQSDLNQALKVSRRG